MAAPLPPLTAEQQKILDTCPNYSDSPQGTLVRVTAAAGAGKTTSLLALAVEARQRGHREISYVTFSKAAALDGQQRLLSVLGDTVVLRACTLHSFAYHALKQHLTEPTGRMLDEKQVKKLIEDLCHDAIEDFLLPCESSFCQKADGNVLRREAFEQVAFFTYKSLVLFCRQDYSFEDYIKVDKPPFGRDYYPAVKFFQDRRRCEQHGFDYYYSRSPFARNKALRFLVDQVKFLWETINNESIRSHDFDMKRVQLAKMEIPGSILLVDESQDMDGCQVDWVTNAQNKFNKTIYVVGDPAQTIYGFRGAKSQNLMKLRPDTDIKLRETWRFGPGVANIANLILFAKEHSPQSVKNENGECKNWIPYRIKSGSAAAESFIVDTGLKHQWTTRKVTLIARTNATLLLEILSLLDIGPTEDLDHVEDPVVEDDESDDGPEFDKLVADNGAVLAPPIESLTVDETVRSLPSAAVFSDSQKGTDDETLRWVPGVNFPKVHINGMGEQSGARKWKQTLELIEAVFQLYLNDKNNPGGRTSLPKTDFPEFAKKTVNWDTFNQTVEEKDLGRYHMVLNIVSVWKEKTLKVVSLFKQLILDQNVGAEEANVILTTCHAAKGMEWDNVEVCDDFLDLNKFKEPDVSETSEPIAKRPRLLVQPLHQSCRTKSEFDLPPWGDDVNLLYVACTRAKKCLAVPQSIVNVLDRFDRPDNTASFNRDLVHCFQEECGTGPEVLLKSALIPNVAPT